MEIYLSEKPDKLKTDFNELPVDGSLNLLFYFSSACAFMHKVTQSNNPGNRVEMALQELSNVFLYLLVGFIIHSCKLICRGPSSIGF